MPASAHNATSDEDSYSDADRTVILSLESAAGPSLIERLFLPALDSERPPPRMAWNAAVQRASILFGQSTERVTDPEDGVSNPPPDYQTSQAKTLLESQISGMLTKLEDTLRSELEAKFERQASESAKSLKDMKRSFQELMSKCDSLEEEVKGLRQSRAKTPANSDDLSETAKTDSNAAYVIQQLRDQVAALEKAVYGDGNEEGKAFHPRHPAWKRGQPTLARSIVANRSANRSLRFPRPRGWLGSSQSRVEKSGRPFRKYTGGGQSKGKAPPDEEEEYNGDDAK